jgi:hypothetical protein
VIIGTVGVGVGGMAVGSGVSLGKTSIGVWVVGTNGVRFHILVGVGVGDTSLDRSPPLGSAKPKQTSPIPSATRNAHAISSQPLIPPLLGVFEEPDNIFTSQ